MSLYNWKYNGNVARTANKVTSSGVLSNAQLLALHTTPVPIVPAPPSGSYVSVDEIVLTLNVSGSPVAFTGNNALEFRYTDGSGNKVTGDAAYAWAQGTAAAAVKVIQAAVTPIGAAAVVAVVPSANWAAGDSTISYSVSYRVVKLP